MSKPQVSTRFSSFSASCAVEKAGESLRAIKDEDNLTYSELGEEIGKGLDQAERIAKGNSVMDMPTFLRACRRWNGRFADDVLGLIGMKLVPLDTGENIGPITATQITRLLFQLSVALEDGEVDDVELAAMRSALDGAGRAIDTMRERLAKKAVHG